MRIILLVLLLAGCEPEKPKNADATASQFLYVSAGACYAGNNTAFTNLTSSNLIYRINTESGQRETLIADYFASPANAGDSPASLVSLDSDYLYVLVENATTATLRRIERVEKKQFGSRTSFFTNTTALNGVVKDLSLLPSGDLYVAKVTGVELVTSAGARVGLPYINPSAAPCASTNTGVQKVIKLNNNKALLLHAATGQNRIAVMNSSGGTACQAIQAAPNAASFPSTMAYERNAQKLFVAYSGNATTTDLTSIYVYDVNETTGALSSPQKIYDASLYPSIYPVLLYGMSAMTLDLVNRHLYIASAISTATTLVNQKIEKFSYDLSQLGTNNPGVLSRTSTLPFYPYGNDTKCISSMEIAD